MQVSSVDGILAQIRGLPAGERAKLAGEVMAETRERKFIPNPGPQTEAYLSPADILYYGGEAGGGKTGLIAGLALSEHDRTLVMRRQYTDLGAIIDATLAMNRSRDGYNGSAPPSLRTEDGRLIEFGAAQRIGDEQRRQGSPHDLIAIDEAPQFARSQVDFLMGWNRPDTTVSAPDRRCRVVLCGNPPLTAEGLWLLEMFGAWLDPAHPKFPTTPGQLRWYVRDDDDKDVEVDGPDADFRDKRGKRLIPLSRTFIRARLSDNPFLAGTRYEAQLDALPARLRGALRDGDFETARTDQPDQVIPTDWIRAAQARWTVKPPEHSPFMTAIGADVAQGGQDETVLSPRYDAWFAPLIAMPGEQTPYGRDVAGLIISHRRHGAAVIIDLGGGYGGAAMEHLVDGDPNFPIVAYKGAEKTNLRTRDGGLRFTNKRSAALWQFREALDPSQPGGSPVALPPDQSMVADLAAPTFSVGPNGITVESKEDVCKRLHRSTDRGDAVVMSWWGQTREALDRVGFLGLQASEQGQRMPRGIAPANQNRPVVVRGHTAVRRMLGR